MERTVEWQKNNPERNKQHKIDYYYRNEDELKKKRMKRYYKQKENKNDKE